MIKKQRLFLAIKLPAQLIEQITEYQKNLNPEIFRIVPAENLHLTIVFIGGAEGQKTEEIKKVVSGVAKKFSLSEIKFEETVYGPNPENPRLIWLKGKYNLDYENLKKELEDNLIRAGVNLEKENRKFLPHITLARIKEQKSHLLPLPGKVEKKMFFAFTPQGIWLMESLLMPIGAQYKNLEEFSFSVK